MDSYISISQGLLIIWARQAESKQHLSILEFILGHDFLMQLGASGYLSFLVFTQSNRTK